MNTEICTADVLIKDKEGNSLCIVRGQRMSEISSYGVMKLLFIIEASVKKKLGCDFSSEKSEVILRSVDEEFDFYEDCKYLVVADNGEYDNLKEIKI